MDCAVGNKFRSLSFPLSLLCMHPLLLFLLFFVWVYMKNNKTEQNETKEVFFLKNNDVRKNTRIRIFDPERERRCGEIVH